MILINFIFLICLIFLINGLLNPFLFNNFNKSNFPNNNSLPKSSNSSTWSRIWEDDTLYGEHIVTDTSYNVYIAGTVYTNQSDKALNIKYDKYGVEQWNRTWKVNGFSYHVDFSIDSQSNIYNLIVLSPRDLSVLMKINSTGVSQWNRSFKGNAKCIYLDQLDNIYISGYIWDWENDKQYIYLKKFNQKGISLWNSTFIRDDYHSLMGYPRTIMVDHLNRIFVAGYLTSEDFPYAYISIYDSLGTLISFHKWEIYDYYIKSNMILDTSCNLYLMGIDKTHTRNKIFKYNSSGKLLFSSPEWHKDAIEEHSEFWEFIAQDPLNNTYCSGTNYFWNGRDNFELYVVKFDNQGNFEWEGAYNYYGNTWHIDIYIDSNFSIYLIGVNDGRFFILKNPILGAAILDPFYFNIELIIYTSSIFCIWGLIGIFFYVRFLRRSPKKVLNTA